MAFKQQETSFLGFIEEFFKTPVEFPNKIYALYRDNKKRTITLVQVRPPQSNETDSSFISTFVAGGEEALKDVKGINTAISAEDLFKNPIKTVKTLGQKTFEQIVGLDEISSDKRSDVLEGLTKGKLTQRGKDVLNAQSDVVKGLQRMGLSLVDPTDLTDDRVTATTLAGQLRSGIQLLGTPEIANAPEDDRQVLEQKKGRDKQYKAYRDLAGSLTGLSGYMEAAKPRKKFYNESIVAYNRIIASELGVDLDKVLPVKGKRDFDPSVGRIRIHDTKGSFSAELEAGSRAFSSAKENLENLLSDETRFRRALSLDPSAPYNDALWNNLDPSSKDVLRGTLRSEFINQEHFTRLKGSSGETAFDEYLGNGPTSKIVKQKYEDLKGKAKDSDLQEGIIERETNKVALEAQIKAQLNDNILRARIAEAAKIQVERQSLENIATELGLPSGSITSLTDSRIPAARLTAIQDDISNASQQAIDRYISATKSANISNNLFFAATTKEFLESIEKGDFIEVALIGSRLIGTLPFVNAKLGAPAEYTQIFDKIGIPGTAINIGNSVNTAAKIKNKIVGGLGIAFDDIDDPKDLPLLPKIAGKLTGGLSNKAFEADVWVEWNRANPRGGITQWTQQRISPSQAGGLFGKWGLHETLSTAWGADGSLFKAAGFANPEDFNPAKLLENTATAQGFLENLKLGAQDFINTGTESSPYAKIARMMGLTDFEADPLTGFPIINAATGLPQFKGLEAFEQQLAKLNAAGGGFSLLEMLGDPNQTKGTFPLEAGARWDFLSRIFKEKKVAQLISDNGTAIKFIGLLNKYNRVANAAYIFFYRELLGGGYAGSNVIFKTISTLLKPIRGLGFADETLISEAVAKWGIVKWFKGLSTKLFTMSDNPALAGSRNIFVKMLGSVGLKSLGFLAQGTAGSLTGGLAYLISAVGQMGVSFFKSILWDNKGRLDMALKAAAGVITSKIRTLSKLLVGIVLLGCSCFMVPIFFVMVIVAMMAPMEPATGGGAYADVVLSKKVQVEKTAVQSGTDITYRISITNITNTSTDPEIPPQDITITSFTDRLSYARSCSAGGGIVDVTSDPSLGSVSIPAIGSLPKTTLIPGETIEVGPFTLSNINPADGTYLNTVEVLIEGDDKKGEASVSTSIGAGGCAVCPAGWPTQPFVLTQGAQTSSSHRNAEALDLASGIGQSVKATHNGKAYTFDNKCDDDDHSKECGYGNYIEIVSPMGFSTIYAHLVGFQIGNNQEVAANEIIGYLGTSGNSTGPHLHYEFKNTSVQCIPNRPLRMQYYNEPTFPGSYIPENIPNPNCVDDVNCNMSR